MPSLGRRGGVCFSPRRVGGWLVCGSGAASLHAAEGRGQEVLLRLHVADKAPLTAARYLALAARLGDDDMFSSDLSDAELQVGRRAVLGWWCCCRCCCRVPSAVACC